MCLKPLHHALLTAAGLVVLKLDKCWPCTIFNAVYVTKLAYLLCHLVRRHFPRISNVHHVQVVEVYLLWTQTAANLFTIKPEKLYSVKTDLNMVQKLASRLYLNGFACDVPKCTYLGYWHVHLKIRTLWGNEQLVGSSPQRCLLTILLLKLQ